MQAIRVPGREWDMCRPLVTLLLTHLAIPQGRRHCFKLKCDKRTFYLQVCVCVCWGLGWGNNHLLYLMW